MKTYQLSDDRTVTVKKNVGQPTVTIKQKDSAEKFIEFTPSRWAQFRQSFDEIDGKVTALLNNETVKYCQHIGGGHYVSVTTGFSCVDFRKFYMPKGQSEAKPTRTGIALRLKEWSEMKKLIETVNNDFPALATALPCYLQTDHQNQLSALDCRECYPFLQ